MKKIILGLLPALLLVFSACENIRGGYKTGVEFDADAVTAVKQKLENASVKNYSYTFSEHTCGRSFAIEVEVENGKLKSYELKEFRGRLSTDVNEDSWKEMEDEIASMVEEKHIILTIDEMLQDIFKRADLYLTEYENDTTGLYYASVSVQECEDIPYFDCYKYFRSRNVEEDKYSNNSATVISISDFKVLD